MKSKAAIENHPLHPALVRIPVGAFVLALIGDIATTATTGLQFWYSFALYCILIGILVALLAAAFGLVDYLGVPMSAAAKHLATTHMVLNLSAVLLCVASLLPRMNNAAFQTGLWIGAMALDIIALATLGTSGWLGGQLACVHRVGVVESEERTQRAARWAS